MVTSKEFLIHLLEHIFFLPIFTPLSSSQRVKFNAIKSLTKSVAGTSNFLSFKSAEMATLIGAISDGNSNTAHNIHWVSLLVGLGYLLQTLIVTLF
jgi:hypothetical protein